MTRSRARAAVSRKPRGTIDEWAEAQLEAAQERVDRQRSPIRTPTPPTRIPRTWLRLACVVAILILLAVAWRASATETAGRPIEPRAVHVIDGDTIRVDGVSYRLVGFDAPETGDRAECQAEIDRGWRAYARLVDLVWSGRPLSLEPVACSCAPGTAGTTLCNYGRQCGTLRIAGEDVGAILMHEGLAKPYAYRWPHPPRKPRWCRAHETWVEHSFRN